MQHEYPSIPNKINTSILDNIDEERIDFYKSNEELITELLCYCAVVRQWDNDLRIEVNIYSNRLEIICPFDYQNIDSIKEQINLFQFPINNSIIYQILSTAGLIDIKTNLIKDKIKKSNAKIDLTYNDKFFTLNINK